MNDKKLKRLSLINVITGYVMMSLFILLVLLNRSTTPEIVNVVDEDPEGLFTGITPDPTPPEIVYIDRNIPTVVDRSVGIDRLHGVVIDDDRDVVIVDDVDPHVAVVRDSDHVILHDGDDRLYINRDGDTIADIDNERFRDRTHIIGDDYDRVDHLRDRTGIGQGIRTVDDDAIGRVDLDAYDRAIREDALRDDDILDRRLREQNIGLDKDDDSVDLAGLTLARDDDDVELGDIDLNFDSEPGKDYGIGKGGQLYAYNFPSKGVGAGIGNSAIGAGAGGGAGLGAGIGQGVLNGETVPTLGGVGTYSSIPVVTPGTGSDSDGDGLTAEAEAVLGTDPSKSDSDGDGYVDGAEISTGTNPLNAASNPGVPGSEYTPTLGGVGGLVGGAGAGGAAGLVTGVVTAPLGVGPGKGIGYGVGNGVGHGHRDYEYDLPPDGALHIMIHVDGSGSLLSTRVKLDEMKETLLKEALLPYYNNDESLYDKRVTIIDDSGERTLQFFTQATKKDNVLAIAFQDEAAPDYHLPNFNKVPQSAYSLDLKNLKSGLNGYSGVYRGVMFQVDRGRTLSKSFKEMVECAWNGEGYLSEQNLKRYHRDNNRHHIKNKHGVVFSDEYHAKSEADPAYYLDLIFKASERVGLNLRARGAGLTDGKYNKAE